jgi:hypothetical protein
LELLSSLVGSLTGGGNGANGTSGNSSGSIDSSKLYLLQTTFRSLENFFSLAESATSGASGNGTVNAGDGTRNNAGELQTVAQSIAKATDIRRNIDYVSPEEPAIVMEARMTPIIEKVSPILNSGFEFDLAEKLFEAQEKLRKTRMRLGVLEMVQEEAMLGENSVYIDDDDDALPRDHVLADSANGLDEIYDSRDGSLRKAGVEDEIIKEVDAKWGSNSSKVTSFEGIMSELSTLRACLCERATVDYPLGHLLDSNVAVVTLQSEGSKDRESSAADDSGCSAVHNHAPDNLTLPVVVRSMTDTTKELLEIVKVKTQASSTNQNVLLTLKQQEEKIAGFKTAVEQSDIARNEMFSLTVELQVLRERIQRYAKDEAQMFALQAKNIELMKHIKDLEDLPSDSKSRRSDGSIVTSKGDSKKIHELKTLNQQLELQRNALSVENERMQKENQRLKGTVTVSEQRVKGALQDQMSLHQQLQLLEEENMNAKATITKLTREIEDHKISRGHREDADRRISELQRELHKRDVELAEAREDASMANKHQAELAMAEKTIEHLEMSLGEMTVELEKGSVAMMQLDNYRDQLRSKTKENRDMSLHIHGLENQLKDVPYLQTRYAEVQEELEDCKMKIDKLPGLLSEQARLRGNSRASVKALAEHDKMLSHYKNRVNQLERETAILKNDNRMMQELESKLKEANQEIKRLLTAIADGNNPSIISAPVQGLGSYQSSSSINMSKFNIAAEEEKKKSSSNDGQYRKMRSRIRQSIAAGGGGAGGTAAVVAMTMNHS